MPPSSRTLAQAGGDAQLPGLKAYAFHGIELEVRNGHGIGECPFCGASGKFSVDIGSGLWRCWVCGGGTSEGGGNPLTFLRLWYTHIAETANGVSARVATDRKYSCAATPAAWGVTAAPDGTIIVPGYATDGRLDQLYRRVWTDKGWVLMCTPGVWPEGRAHALHLPASTGRDFDPRRANVYVCEGPWDGMALWEVFDDIGITGCQVLAVPGCNVWRDEWTNFCRGKTVILMYDSDHPRAVKNSQRTQRAGYNGMVRVAARLAGIASLVRWVKWGPDGYDPALPDGWDVRDHLTQPIATKRALLDDLFAKVEDVPDSVVPSRHVIRSGTNIESRDCSTWLECEGAYKAAMKWRQDLSDMLAVTLAVCASTNQGGNQLFLDIVGSPGSGKTTIIKGALTSYHCVHVENITKILSGYKMQSDGGGDKDCSFLARANGKTWITCEFDTILTSPQYVELMGKMRRVFDGETSSTYANSDKDRIYASLRTPWIRAGTWKMMEHDQSQLGDRFLRVIINDPPESEKREILRSAWRSERAAIIETGGSLVDEKTRMAYSLMGGYVDWLRANVEQKLAGIHIDESAEETFFDLAELSADLRARPNEDKRKKENSDCKELPTRLARQYGRLAIHLAVVFNKQSVDTEVLRVVRKVALDTSHGHSLNIVKWLTAENPRAGNVTYQEAGGLGSGSLQMWTCMTEERLTNYLTFLRKIGVLEHRTNPRSGDTWVLTDRVLDTYKRIMGF
jgi:ribosomal protein L37AE/L43A